MSNLKIYVLGPPKVDVDGTDLDVDTRKATALLVYLAVSGKPISRSTLAAMFWPDYPTQRARANLRRTLSVLRSALDARWLRIDGDTIDLDHDADLWLDVCTFRDLLGRLNEPDIGPQTCIDTLVKAAETYRDDFMQGFVLKDCPAFDEWQFFLREELRQELADALKRLVELLVSKGDYADAIKYAQRWVALDSSSETAHRTLIRLYADNGQRSAALRQYTVCARYLASELGVEPSMETSTLYQAVKSGHGSNANESESGNSTLAPDAVSAAEAHEIVDELRTVTVLSLGLGGQDETLGQSERQRAQDFTQKARAIVTQYDGRLDRSGAGHFLASFGMEKAREDDPLRAVYVALALRALADEYDLLMAAGIGTDLVHRTGRWSPSRGLSAISGPVLDLVARLQLEADPGQILVTESTFRQTRHGVHYALTPQRINFRRGLIVAYVVVGRRNLIAPAVSVDGQSTAMFGRDRELSAIQSALAQLLQGQGQIILVTGDAGVGKSRLIAETRKKAFELSPAVDLSDLFARERSFHEFTSPTAASKSDVCQSVSGQHRGRLKDSTTWNGERQAEHDLLWLEGRCLELGRNSSYWPVVDMLHALLGWRHDDDNVARPRRLAFLLRTLVQATYLSEAQVDEIAPLLGQLLSLRFGNHWDKRPQTADPEAIYRRTFSALCALFEALSKWIPIAFVVEDFHWADERSIDLIIHLMELVQQVPLLVLCTYRYDQQQRCWQLGSIAEHKCPDRQQVLRLRALTPEQSRQLVDAYGIAGVDAATKQLIVDRAQGNPLFLEEIARSLLEHSALTPGQHSGQTLTERQAAFLPRRLQEISQGRVDQLEPALRRLVRRASVIGRVFSKRILSRLMPAHIDLDGGLDRLVAHTLIVQERALPEVEYAFKHVLIQEAIYASIPAWRRRALHGEAAEAIEASTNSGGAERTEQLAFHYERSDNGERAVYYLVMAAQMARMAYLNDEAIQYFLRAQERLDGAAISGAEEDGNQAWVGGAQQVQIETGLGQVHHVIGDEPRAARHFRRALALQQQVDASLTESIRLLCWLGDVLLWQGQFEEVIDIGRQGVEMLAENPVSIEAALMYQTLAFAAKIRGNYKQFWRYTEKTEQFIRDLPYAEELMPAYVQIGEMHHDRGNSTKAVAWAAHSTAVAEKHRDLRLLAGTYYNLGCLFADMGKLESAIDYLQRAADTYVRAGDESQRRVCLFVLAHAFLANGQIEAAKEALATLDPVENQRRSVLGMAIPDSGNAALALSTGCAHEGVEASKRWLGLIDNVDLPLRDACARVILGRVLLAGRDIDNAYRQFRRAITRCDPVLLLNAPLNTLGWPFRPLRPLLAAALAGLEETFDDRTDFQRFCRAYRAEHPSLDDSPFRCWRLTEPEAGSRPSLERLEPIALYDVLPSDANWQDPLGDCSYCVQHGVGINAANGRDLWGLNRSTPRVLWPCGETVSFQSKLGPAAKKSPILGGLLLWIDEDNYLCLERGVCGPADLLFHACLGGQTQIVGRGRLPGAHIRLKLEKSGRQVTAYCSTDGEAWQSVGQMLLPVHGSAQIGIYAIGNIDRTVYAGAFRQGTTVWFEELQMR